MPIPLPTPTPAPIPILILILRNEVYGFRKLIFESMTERSIGRYIYIYIYGMSPLMNIPVPLESTGGYEGLNKSAFGGH